MKSFLTTTALAAALAIPAFAQDQQATEDQSTTDSSFAGTMPEDAMRASDFIGSRLYTTEGDIENVDSAESSEDWSDVGEIGDVVMTPDGQIELILVDVGGFLGVGEKTVAIQLDQLKFVNEPDEVHLLFKSTREQLENAPEYEEPEGGRSGAAADPQNQTEQAGQLPETVPGAADQSVAQETSDEVETGDQPADEAADSKARDGAGHALTAPGITREGYSAAAADVLTTENLTGAPVYDANDEWIGEVSELMVDDQGKITDAVVDVGGFLGVGEKPVAVAFDSMTVAQQDDGDDIRVYSDATLDQLEEMPRYED